METNTTQERAGDRPLKRSSSDRMIAGVASGIAHRLDIPAWVVRVAFIVLAFGGALGVALYIAGWLLIPNDNEEEPVARRLFESIQDGSGWMGVGLVGIGVLIAASSVDFIRGDLAVAVFLAVVGVLLYRGELGTSSEKERPEKAASEEADLSPTSASFAGSGSSDGPHAPAPVPSAAPPRPSKPKNPPSMLGRIAIAVVLIANGVMAFFDYAVTTFDPSPRHYLGLTLGIIGLALIVGSVMGRARGLIVLGIFLAPLLILSPLAEFELGNGIGERQVTVLSVDEMAPSYNLAIGELVVDLRNVDFGGRTVELNTSVGLGSLQVLVPADVAVVAAAEVGIGEVQIFGAVRSGFARTLNVDRSGNGTLVLDAQVLIGEVRVSTSETALASSVGDLSVTVTDPVQLQDTYSLRTGDIRLDLSSLVLDEPRTVTITNGVGSVEVIVPDRSTTAVSARAGIGDVTVFGNSQSGFRTRVDFEPEGPNLLTLNIEINSGEIVVEEN
jgi:phage shock protein PspC (stress-responsive transcriptional regulator)/predicted membrane protein